MWRALFLALLLPSAPALAQMWPNEVGLGGDIMAGSGRQFDRLRQAAPAAPAPAFAAPAPASPFASPAAIPPGRAPIPMLDWAAPPLPAATPRQ
ncbi:hypothetical protein, partial [Teichococcus aestuarii]|uniref:hypothetical protein n=1 Tax=Teichococcus aestuarii TaxID=568898 RepID=UPI003621E467